MFIAMVDDVVCVVFVVLADSLRKWSKYDICDDGRSRTALVMAVISNKFCIFDEFCARIMVETNFFRFHPFYCHLDEHFENFKFIYLIVEENNYKNTICKEKIKSKNLQWTNTVSNDTHKFVLIFFWLFMNWLLLLNETDICFCTFCIFTKKKSNNKYFVFVWQT